MTSNKNKDNVKVAKDSEFEGTFHNLITLSMFCSAGFSRLPRSGLRASEFLRFGFSNWHVPDGARTGED